MKVRIFYDKDTLEIKGHVTNIFLNAVMEGAENIVLDVPDDFYVNGVYNYHLVNNNGNLELVHN